MTAPRTITEKTLLPISLVGVFLGLAVYVGGVAADARDAKARVEVERMERLHVEDGLVERVNELRSKAYGMDAKLDLLVNQAKAQR